MHKTPPSKSIETYGTQTTNPVLLSSISASYEFCRKLARLDEELKYQRKGSTVGAGFEKPIDMYDFSYAGRLLCTIYIYPYYSENIEEVPACFFHLGRHAETWAAMVRQALPGLEKLFEGLVEYYLVTNGICEDGKIDREKALQECRINMLLQLTCAASGKEDEQERVVLEEWKIYTQSKRLPHRKFFVNELVDRVGNGAITI